MEGVIYKMKVVDFHEKETHLLYQDANGKWPIVALGRRISTLAEFPLNI